MAEEIKPIKRSTELAPLSRDHHEGLLLVWKIRQGIKNGTEISVISSYISWFWKNHLEEHFKEEEQILAPCLAADNELIKQMFGEHEEIEALIHINDTIADEALLSKFADTLNDHIRFEERKLFNVIEQSITKEELENLGNKLKKEKQESSVWENEFWLKK